jgi:hypothetical protein
MWRWHAVVITADSVSGIPLSQPLKCDDCRESIPRIQVDSMNLGYQTAAQNVFIIGVIVASIVALVLNPK